MTLNQDISISSELAKLKLVYEKIYDEKINLDSPLIYKWTIFNKMEDPVGVYIGKAKNGHKRPTTQYSRNVDRLLSDGENSYYRKNNQNGWRKVHKALAQAVRLDYVITLEFVCNISPDENIDKVEKYWIEKEKCYGCEPWQLNGRA